MAKPDLKRDDPESLAGEGGIFNEADLVRAAKLGNTAGRMGLLHQIAEETGQGRALARELREMGEFTIERFIDVLSLDAVIKE